MDIQTSMSNADTAKLKYEVDAFNKTLNEGKVQTKSLGKDDFLKILMTQLQNQDPSAPMQDKEFIAQMAQFSSLEQMTQMSNDFSRIAGMIQSSQAQSVLGKNVAIDNAGQLVTGVVQAVTTGAYPEVMVNEASYSFDQVTTILN